MPTLLVFRLYIVIGWPDVGSRGSVGVVIAERVPFGRGQIQVVGRRRGCRTCGGNSRRYRDARDQLVLHRRAVFPVVAAQQIRIRPAGDLAEVRRAADHFAELDVAGGVEDGLVAVEVDPARASASQ